jgi:HD superfamily phosphohydrolase/NAD-dependent SIR2 family protein deacetylase
MNENKYKKSIEELAKRMWEARRKRKRIMILAGSGISKDGGVPLFGEIFDHFHEECRETGYSNENWKHLPDFERLSPADIDQLILSEPWKKTVEWLRSKIDKAHPTEAHKIIADLCGEEYVDYIFSLNYDDLFERVCGDKVECIKLPERLRGLLLEEPKTKPYLVKVHGDKSMVICLGCGHPSLTPATATTSLERCPECGKSLIPYILLPDSAKVHGRNFIDLLINRAEYFDLIVTVGFSGRHDPHVMEMLKYFQSKNVVICNIHPRVKEQPLRTQIEIPDKADEIFSKLKEELNRLGKPSWDITPKPSSFFDSVYKKIELTDIEKDICFNEAFLRLKGIHQLGLKYCKFISANHTRFEHSIGTMKVADEMYLRLKCIDREGNLKSDDRRNAEERQFLRLAALLHDIGHVWFGHLGEEVMKEVWGNESHEKFLEKVIDKSFKDTLNNHLKTYTLNDLIRLIQGISGIKVLEKIIKSTFDADKIEYLLRDSRMTGREYGVEVDKDTLFDNLVVDDEGELYISEEAVSALERIAEARYHMYKEVYADFDVRGYESLFKKALDGWIRYKRLDGKVLDDPELVKFLLKKDEEILRDMEKDLQENIKRDENIPEAWKHFFEKTYVFSS